MHTHTYIQTHTYIDAHARKQMPEINGADPMAASLLIECRGQTNEALQVRERQSVGQVTRP